MASFNRVVLMGNLTRDVEMRFSAGGMAVGDIGLAVNDSYVDKQTGERVQRPNFVNCVAFGKTAESAAKFFTKGDPIHIEGKLRFEQWQDKISGEKRSQIKVVVDRWTFCGTAGGERTGGAQGPQVQGDHSIQYDEDIPF